PSGPRKTRSVKVPPMSMPMRVSIACGSAPDAEHAGDVVAEDQVLLRSGEEAAMAAHVVDALPVGAEALDIGHVGTPDELRRPPAVAHVADQRLRLGIGVVPHAAPG